MNIQELKLMSGKIKENISKVIVGKEDVIDLVLVCLFSSGHVLLEDVPGVGKTMLAKCLAKSLGCEYKRIQFTPDLLPSDLTGINYYNQKQSEFVFRPGPIFANIILADEINRATPRTQSSLLECMEEKQVTVDGETKQMASPFFVIATQNPIEQQGTFPLPEAQLDRFFMRLKIGYPSGKQARELLDRFQTGSPYDEVQSVISAEEVNEALDVYKTVKIKDEVKDYIVSIVESTRKHPKVVLGVSPRGSISLMKASMVYAAIKGRDYVMPDDIKTVAAPVLAHRIVLKGHAITNTREEAEKVIFDVLQSVPVPTESFKEQ